MRHPNWHLGKEERVYWGSLGGVRTESPCRYQVFIGVCKNFYLIPKIFYDIAQVGWIRRKKKKANSNERKWLTHAAVYLF